MGKKRDKANENILILIDELISARESALGTSNCCHWRDNIRPCHKYDSDCELCKETYFAEMRRGLEEKYIVK